MAEADTASRRRCTGWISAAIVVEGTVTLVAALLMFPIGAVLVIVNAALAVVTRGIKRKLFAGYAIIGAALCGIVALSLLSGTFQ